MKSKKDILIDFVNIVEQGNIYFFKLFNGKDCFGEIELVDDSFLHFNPASNEKWIDCNYERYYAADCEQCDPFQLILISLRDIDADHLYCWSNEEHCFMNYQWDFHQESWICYETKPGSIPLSDYCLETIEDDRQRKDVGYWQSEEWEPYLPHPRYLVEPGWRKNERSLIVAYLKSGHQYSRWQGYSYCRFDCFLKNRKKAISELERRALVDEALTMGSRDLTDGEWIWPEGLAHYVEKHDVCLPDSFVETMQKNSWMVPTKNDIESRFDLSLKTDICYWVNWSIKYFKSKSS